MDAPEITPATEAPAVGAQVQHTVRRCWFLHSWSRWEDVHRVEKHSAAHNTLLATGIQQNRRCLRCGQLDMRVAWIGV